MISVILADIGQALFASSLVPFVLGLDVGSIRVLLSGLALSVVCWVLSVILAKGNKYDNKR